MLRQSAFGIMQEGARFLGTNVENRSNEHLYIYSAIIPCGDLRELLAYFTKVLLCRKETRLYLFGLAFRYICNITGY